MWYKISQKNNWLEETYKEQQKQNLLNSKPVKSIDTTKPMVNPYAPQKTWTKDFLQPKPQKKLITKKVIATAYCACETCCGVKKNPNAKGITKSGTQATAGRTIAVPPEIPLGTTVYVDGKPYIAEDTGSAIKGNRIDIYFDDHQEALNWGRKPVTISYYA